LWFAVGLGVVAMAIARRRAPESALTEPADGPGPAPDAP
jgi:hypothetical protein